MFSGGLEKGRVGDARARAVSITAKGDGVEFLMLLNGELAALLGASPERGGGL